MGEIFVVDIHKDQHFDLEERILQKDNLPLLSCSDMESPLRAFLPRRDVKQDEVLR